MLVYEILQKLQMHCCVYGKRSTPVYQTRSLFRVRSALDMNPSVWCRILNMADIKWRNPSPLPLPADRMTDRIAPCAAVRRGGNAAPCGFPSWLPPSFFVFPPRPCGLLAGAATALSPPEPWGEEHTLLPRDKTLQQLIRSYINNQNLDCLLHPLRSLIPALTVNEGT